MYEKLSRLIHIAHRDLHCGKGEGNIISESFERAKELRESEGYIKLGRGFATIPLPGIDMPFHPRYLWAGILPFKACESSDIPYPEQR